MQSTIIRKQFLCLWYRPWIGGIGDNNVKSLQLLRLAFQQFHETGFDVVGVQIVRVHDVFAFEVEPLAFFQ